MLIGGRGEKKRKRREKKKKTLVLLSFSHISPSFAQGDANLLCFIFRLMDDPLYEGSEMCARFRVFKGQKEKERVIVGFECS